MNSLKLIFSKLKYFSSVWVFFSLNLLIGTWVLYIPHVKHKLILDDSEIGFALFCYALGILLFIPIIPLILKKIGVGKYTMFGIVFFAISFVFPLLAPNYTLLCISLFFVGIFSGTTDIAVNSLVSEIEKSDSCNFMSSAHGFFSLGGAIGGMFGSLLISTQLEPIWHMAIVVIFIIGTNLFLGKNYHSILEEREVKETSKYHLKSLKPLIIIAFIAFVIMSSEGAIEHWSTLYLAEVVKVTPQNLTGLGFIVFSIMMTLGRFFGDKISEGIGSIKIIFYGCLLAIFGYVCILFSSLIITIFGFGLLGMGLSVIIPELFRIAGKTKGVASSVGISFVSGIGFVGFLIGPVLLGYISNAFSLKSSFLILLVLVIVALLLSVIKLKKNEV